MKIELSVVKVYTFFGHPKYAPEYISEFRDSQRFFPLILILSSLLFVPLPGSKIMGIGIRHIRIEIPLI